MGFFKSLFGGSESKPAPVLKEMEGIEQQLIDILFYACFKTNPLYGEQSYPWTPQKQEKYFLQFAKEKFVFDQEINSMCLVGWNVDKDLSGTTDSYLFKETTDEHIAYREEWGE